MKKKGIKITIFIVLIIISLLTIFIFVKKDYDRKLKIKKEEEQKAKIIQDIKKHYGEVVVTNKDTKLYLKENNKYKESGQVAKNRELTLEKLENITFNNKYLKLSNLKDYYVYYENIDKKEKPDVKEERYKRYIPFNLNASTREKTNLYDKDNNLIYTFNKSMSFPVIIKEEERKGVIFDNELLFLKNEEIDIKENNNTNEKSTPSIAVLNYHFFYDENDLSSIKECGNQEICMPMRTFKNHIKYIKDNNFFTPTMREFDLYLNKKINLPKSVLITIDDGWLMDRGIKYMEEEKINGTVFLITTNYGDYDYSKDYKYIEFHSHGDDLHHTGKRWLHCPGGQGGPIKCLNHDELLKDLKTTREKLHNTTYFCYPFYEYNDYAIKALKEAGFTLAFAGARRKAYPGVNRYVVPRYPILNSMISIANIVN